MSDTQKRVYVKHPIEKRIVTAHQKGCLLLARSMPSAIEKLIELLEDENHETARKAGVDLIKLQLTQSPASKPQDDSPSPAPLDPELADRLLKALSQDD